MEFFTTKFWGAQKHDEQYLVGYLWLFVNDNYCNILQKIIDNIPEM